MNHPTRQDSTDNSLCYTSCEALAEMEGRKLFYLTMHIIFTVIWRQTYGKERTIQIARGNPLPPHGLLFLISSKGSFICTIPDRIAHIRSLLHQSWSTGWNEK